MSNYSDSSFNKDNANTSWYKVYHLIPNKSKVLDIGCSSGNFGVELINRKKCIVDGIELDKLDFEKAKKNLRKVYNLNIETDDLSIIKDTYDVIYLGDVVEHLVNPSEALKRVKKLLNSNGKIIFSIPNMAHIAVRLLLLKGDFDYTETGLLDKTHLHYYSLEEVYRVFREGGYEVEQIDFVQKDYPKPLIESWLKGIGLTANKDFYEAMKQPEAAAFQFVGVSIPAKATIKVKRQQFGPIDLFDSYHRNTVDSLNLRISELESANSTMQVEHSQLKNRWNALKKNPVRFSGSVVKRKVFRKK